VKTYPVLDHFCIDFLLSPSILLPIYSMGTDTKANLGKPASATPPISRRPSPSGSSNKLQRPDQSQSPSQFNNPSKSTPPPTTRVSTKQPANPNSAALSVPNHQGQTSTTTKPHNTTAKVQGFFDMLSHGR
jgi:hypothetical protein